MATIYYVLLDGLDDRNNDPWGCWEGYGGLASRKEMEIMCLEKTYGL